MIALCPAKRRRLLPVGAALVLCLAGIPADGAVPDRDWPSVEVTPILDAPLRDAAIARGPDGLYYMTGTLGAPVGGGEGEWDFDNARKIKVWRSRDLKAWEDLGVVFDLEKEGGGNDNFNWGRYFGQLPGPGVPEFVRGARAPEMRYARGTWWIVFAVNDQGIGLLKSASGKPEGPYECHARLTVRGQDPSLFVDEGPGGKGEGPVYLVWGEGWIARLAEDMGALAERPRLLMPAKDPVYEPKPNGGLGPRADAFLGDHPLRVGERGAFLFKSRGRYFLTAAESNGRLGVPCDDTFLAYADNVYGPYSERHLMMPHGGAVTVFQGPPSSAVGKFRGPYDGKLKRHVEAEQWYAAVTGRDALAGAGGRPAVAPLEWVGPERWDQYFFKHTESYPRKPQHVFTERGPWPRMKVLNIKEEVRDMAVFVAPDGDYYLSGSVCSRPGEMIFYRSKDLIAWEELPPFWTYEQVEWLPVKLPPAEKLTERDQFSRIFWGSRMFFLEGNYYIGFGIFRNERLAPDNRGVGALRSKTGKPQGPYESVGKIGGQLGVDPGPLWPDFFTAPDGKLYAANTINWRLHVAEVDLNTPGWKWNYKPVDQGGARYATDGFGSVDCIMGRLLLTAVRWDGPVGPVHGGFAESGKHYGTYDVHYAPLAGPWGPVAGAPRVITRIGAGNVFQDQEKRWWGMFFGNDGTGPWWQRPGLVPLKVAEAEGGLRIETAMEFDEGQLRVMGAGEKAEVRTVLETIQPPPGGGG